MSVLASWLWIGAATVLVTAAGWMLSRWVRWAWRTYRVTCEIRDSERTP